MGRNLFRSLIASTAVLALGSGVAQLPGLDVAASVRPKTAEPCTPNHLQAKPDEALTVPGTTGYLVELKNVSNAACTLEGYPQLKMLDGTGGIIPTRVAHGRAFAGANETEVTLIKVKPGWSGLFALTYPNSTNYPSTVCPISDRVDIHIPNMKKSVIFKLRIRPYGGKSGAAPHCGLVNVSYVYGPID